MDLPDGWREDVSGLLDMLLPLIDEFDELLTGQPIFRERLQGVGAINVDECLALGVTGPILRGFRLRLGPPAATCRYLNYAELDFDVIVGTYGDCFDRYAVRLNEARESIKIVQQVHREDAAPATTGCKTRRSLRPPRARIDDSMESADSPLQDLHTRDSKCPRARSMWPSNHPVVNLVVTWSATVGLIRIACISGPQVL